tara:strand:- start:327 stop:905 length:579 start_codon:yes stop_codon:yes gene_type:complete
MKKRLNKRAYFFLIDSILALGVLAIGAFLIFSAYVQIPEKSSSTIFSEDLMDFFADNKVQDINNIEVGLGGTYWESAEVITCNGDPITLNPENTLLQQVGVFYRSYELTTKLCYVEVIARTYTEKLIQNTLPPQYNLEFWMNDRLIYPATEQVDSKNTAEVLIPSKKIVHGIMDQQTGEMFGSYDTEVLVWR